MTRRNTELLLLLIAAPIVILLYAMIVMNEGQTLSVETLGVPLGIFGSFAVAHLAVRKWAPAADPAILPIAFALSGIGIAFITRLAPDMAIRQVMWLFLGIVCMIGVLVFMKNIDRTANYKYTLMIFGILLLLSPMLPGIGTEISGSRIWLSLGSFSFQPGEIAKILIVLFLAGYLAANREMLSVFTMRLGPLRLPDIRTLLPMLLVWGLALIVVIFEKDLGSALVVFFVFLTMLYVTTGKRVYIAVAIILLAIGGVFAYSAFSHVQIRVSTWLDPFADAQGTGYQLCQAIYSMADGGIFGVGIGNGLCDKIPVVESDYIFAAICEEAGLLGAAGVLLLFVAFAVRGIVTAARAKSDVSSFIATGLTASIVLQAFIIVGGVTRLIPLTGLTLPFISQGGSSLLASFIAVGMLLKCGDEATGVGREMTGAIGGSAHAQTGVLGRVALGKRLTGLMIVICLMFAVLVANLTLLMVVNADYYQNLSTNNHTTAKEATRERGTISTSDGVVLAQSIQNEDGTYTRIYPAGVLASHVVGYSSTKYGTSGIESACNDTLSGSTDFATWTDVINNYAGISTSGNDVKLTINSEIQQAAQDALDGYSGACVVLDPETGAVLALASSPTYDAAEFESLLSNSTDSASSDALYNRATQALYAPGSTFKMLTLATALQNGIASEDTVYDAPGSMDIGNAPVTNFDDTSYGEITLARATEVSSNTVFGQVGVQIGPELLVRSAEQYGFNNTTAFELPLSMSLMPDPSEMTTWETAWAAVGQPVGEHESAAGPQATVLQMAMVGAAIANGGTIMQPYLVDSVYNAEGEKASETSPTVYANVMSTSTADRVLEVLQGVVESGTGKGAAISGVNIAGKTGTAQTDKELDNSWFVGMGPTEDCKVVIAIVLEENDGSTNAATRANNVLSTALKVQGAL
ncbi:MAG: FtsW/RodA/SpoVE family cell cycle protein [Eggerthellaceae bacterium]|nr:FtsW/RodA/SpoVE family cell cycle protein [Eggerthellaceae bacterium]